MSSVTQSCNWASKPADHAKEPENPWRFNKRAADLATLGSNRRVDMEPTSPRHAALYN